jgi:hypothetical protein
MALSSRLKSSLEQTTDYNKSRRQKQWEGKMRTKTLRALSHVYVQVLVGIAAGLALGIADPKLAVEMKPLADAFVKLIVTAQVG